MRKNKEIAQDCETCTNHGTMDCPTSALCYSKQNHPYWMNKPMKENRVKIAISDIPLDRLEAICAAEKDGQCVVLPCKVGDTVYKISYDCTNRIRYNPFDENGCSTAEICLTCDTHPCDIRT